MKSLMKMGVMATINQEIDQETAVLLAQELGAACAGRAADGTSPIFVDSGANGGIWSLSAAACGCLVVAVDPQPACTKYLQEAADASGNDNESEITQKLGPRGFP